MFRRTAGFLCQNSVEVSSQRRVVAWFSAQGFNLRNASLILQRKKEGLFSSSSQHQLYLFPPVSDETVMKRPGDSGSKIATHKLKGTSSSLGRIRSIDPLGADKSTGKPLDVICLQAPESRKTVVIFADGGLVGWDVSWPEMLSLRQTLRDAVEGSKEKQTASLLKMISERNTLVESLKFQTYAEYRNLALATEDQTSEQLARSDEFVMDASEEDRNFVDSTTDTIVLSSDEDHRAKIAFSHALAQSVRLDAIDAAANPISGELKRWQSKLASTGKILCSLTKLRKAKTHTLGLLEDLNFKQHIETSPKIFWSSDYQHLRGVYKSACGHLEIGERGGALKTKLETIDDSVSYLHHEVHASSNEFLTWVIIVLITLELLQAMGMFSGLEATISLKSVKDHTSPER